MDSNTRIIHETLNRIASAWRYASDLDPATMPENQRAKAEEALETLTSAYDEFRSLCDLGPIAEEEDEKEDEDA